jgi:hypothetical protein
LKGALEKQGKDQFGIPIKFSFSSLEYFLTYVFYKKLDYNKLKKESEDFFRPVISQIPRMISKIEKQPCFIEIDFKAGWRFNMDLDKM